MFVSPKVLMVKYHGIIPALKYIVTIVNLYQNFLFHMSSCVNINPKNADAMTVSPVPRTVLDTDMKVAFQRPGILNTFT